MLRRDWRIALLRLDYDFCVWLLANSLNTESLIEGVERGGGVEDDEVVDDEDFVEVDEEESDLDLASKILDVA